MHPARNFGCNTIERRQYRVESSRVSQPCKKIGFGQLWVLPNVKVVRVNDAWVKVRLPPALDFQRNILVRCARFYNSRVYRTILGSRFPRQPGVHTNRMGELISTGPGFVFRDRPHSRSLRTKPAERARQTRQGVVPIETALRRWRSQFAPQPTRGFAGFYRIDQRDLALMNAIARGAFEYSDVKVRGGTRFDPCQQHHCFALWTWRPVKCDHDGFALDQAGALQNSQSPADAVMGR
jgi:hypothetical protein